MEYELRDVCAADLESVLRLNESEVPHVGSIGLPNLRWFTAHAAYFRVAADGDAIGAYLVGLRPGTTYASPNYRWFCERYADFAYVDRVAVAEYARRQGLASRLYADFAAKVVDSVPVMTCEVNIRPPNETSLCFHREMGFEQVGSLESEDGSKTVAMLVKRLDQ
jgi:predicted GNAT superfamily acetyltransferase